MKLVKHFELNNVGRDFVVGDIHGCFDKLREKLDEVRFEESKDRLFSVGDLVDRGPQSPESIDWLAKPWFHAVRGNHEQMVIDAVNGMIDRYMHEVNGGSWLYSLPREGQETLYATAFSELPVAMDIVTKNGLVGIVHAEAALGSWEEFVERLESDDFPSVLDQCMWSRSKITRKDESRIKGVIAVIVGHTPIQYPMWLGNVHYIDTGACYGRDITVVEFG